MTRCYAFSRRQRIPKRLLVWAGLLFALNIGQPCLVGAQTKARSRADAKAAANWTIEDIVLMEEATSFQISPDGKSVAWVKYVPDNEENTQIAYLMLSSLQHDTEFQLTRSKQGCTEPKWSPDGQLIAFLSNRPAPDDKLADDETRPVQIWLIRPFGGEPWPLTDREQDITKFEWAGSDRIIFLADDPPVDESANDQVGPEDDTIVVEDDQENAPARLFKCHVRTKKVRRLTENAEPIIDFAVSPDAKWAATVHQQSPQYDYDHRQRPLAFLYDLKAGTRQPIFQNENLHLDQLLWAADSSGCCATNMHSSHSRFAIAAVSEPHFYRLANKSAENIPLGWDRGLSEQSENEEAAGLCRLPDGFLVLLADGVHTAVARLICQAGTWKSSRIAGVHAQHIHGLTASIGGDTVVYAYSAANQPTQWFLAKLVGDRLEQPVQITHLNQHLRGKTFAKAEVVHWKGAGDDEVEGLLYYPHKYESGRRYPLIVNPHGGPLAADGDAWNDSWAHPQNLLCQRGAFVFKPNYHGSSNYGLAWAESIGDGKYYDLELPDIEKGVDALIAKGLVDPARLGLMGYSNGAILAAALTVHTRRYRAASCLAGNVEQTSDWAFTEDGAAFDEFYFGKSPLDEPDLYLKKSPFYGLARVTTPTLIFFGKDDRTVGPHQGWMHYRALQQATKTPVRFLLFPGEDHNIAKLTHQRRKLKEELAWFEKYFFAQP